MEIGAVTELELLEAVQARIIDKVGLYNTSNCYLDDDALPGGEHMPDQDYACSICMPDGKFDENLQVGGSRCNIQETGTLLVTAMQRYGGGPAGRLTTELLTPARSLLTRKHELLTALLIEVKDGAKQPWEPKLPSGQSLFSDGLMVIGSRGPARHASWPLLFVSLSFRVNWRWRL